MMEKGSFHTSPKSVMETDEIVKTVPLPFEMPKGIDFSKTLVERSPSFTVESLLTQNEDLMARLSVSIRRATQLEEKFENISRENASLRARFESVKDQLLILQEKDRMASDRTQNLTGDNEELKSQVTQLEKRFTELYVQAKSLQSQLVRLERYRARVKNAAKNVQARARQAGRLNALNVEQTTAHTQAVKNFESKIAEFREEIEFIQARLTDRDQLYEAKIQLENKLIFAERQHDNYRADIETRLARVTEEATTLRTQLKTKLVELNTAIQEGSLSVNERDHLREETRNLQEQVESLQILWQDKQREMDKLEEKNRSLQKLNQQLSLNLNQARKEVYLLQGELDHARSQHDEQIRALQEEIKLLKRS